MAQRFIELTEEELTGMESGAAQAPSTGKYIEMTDEELNAPFEPGMIQQAVAIMGGARGDEVPRASGFLAQARDLPIQAFKGAGTGVRMLTDLFGANNPVSKAIAGYEDTMDAILSAESRQDSKEMSRILDEAKDKGTYDQVIAGLQAISKAPLETAFNVAGIAVPTLAAGAAGRALQLGKVGITAIGAGIGASQGAGNIKGQIYQGVVDELRNSGETDEEKIHNVASEAQAYNGKNLDQILIGAGLGAVAASTGAEKVLNRVIGGVGLKPSANLFANILKGGITEAVPEGFQGGQEQLAQNLALQRMGRDVPTMRGVVSQATMEAAAGAPLGGFGGAVEYYTAPKPPPIPKPPEVQEQEDIERQANIEASRLMTPTGDRNSEAVLNRIQQNEQAVENLRGSLSTLEPTSPGAASLRMEINARQDELATLRDLQIRLGREIAQATGVSVPIMEAPVAPAKSVTPVTETKPTISTVDRINQKKIELDNEAKKFGADSARQFNTQNALREDLSEDEKSLLNNYANLNAEIASLSWQDASQLSPEQFSIWEKQRFTDKAQQEQDLTDLGKLALAHDSRGDTQKAEKIKGIIKESKRKSDWTISSWAERFNESKTQEEIDLINSENSDWNDSIDTLLDIIKSKSKEPVTPVTRPTPTEAPAEPTISEKPTTSELVGAEPIAVVEQEQVATAEAPAITPAPEVVAPAAPTTAAPTAQEGARGMNLQEVSESAIAAFPDMMEAEGGLLPLTRFTPDEQESLRKAGIVETATTSTGQTYEGVNAAYLWQRRKQLQDERAKKVQEPAAPVTEAPVTPAPEVAPASTKKRKGILGEQYINKDWTSLTRDELPQLDRELYKYYDWAKSVVDKLIPNANDFEKKALIMELRNEITEETAKPEFKDREQYILAQKVAGELLTGKRKKILQRAKERAMSDEYAAWEMGGRFEESPISVEAFNSNAKGRPLPEGYTKQGDLYVYQPTPAVSETITPAEPEITPAPAEAPSTPSSISVGSRVKGKGPQTYIVEEVLTPSQREAELGEQFYLIRNERTGEVGRFESKAIKPVKAKGVRKMAARTRNEEYMRLAQDPEANREELQRMVDEAAKKAGYAGSDYRMQHSAPDRTSTALASIKTSKLVPSDYWENPQWYQSSPEDFESFSIVRDALNRSEKYTSEGKDGSSIAKIEVYRAVPKSVKEASIRNGDWVTPSKIYAQMEGKSIPGGYKIISQKVPLKKLWWDGNSIAELGFDDGQDYVYKNTKNNRKLLDPVTYDDAGNVIPLEERFQPTSPDIRREAATRAIDESLIVPEKDRYTFEEVQAEANKLFGGIPEGFVIVSDTTNPDYEFKAGYDIDNGNIIVNLAYIKKGESVRNLIAHELGHYAAGDPAIRAQLQAFLDGLPAEQRAKLERFVDRVYNKDTGEVRLEEKAVRAFVVMLKKGDNRNVFQKLLDTIKRWLNEKLGTKFQMTDMDAAAVLSGAVDRFRSGEKIAREEEGVRKDTELSRMDNEYLDAVERGDMETAQRMVDEAAKPSTYTFIDASQTQSDKIRWTDSANSQIEFYKSQIAKLPSVEEATREYEALVKAWNDAGLGQSVEDTIKGIIELKLQPPPSNLDEYLQTRIYLERENAETEIKKSQETLSRAPKGRTETEFKTGQPTIVKAYHSTPFGRLTEFSDEMLGRFTGAPSATKAHFFAGSPSVSETYFADDAWLLNHKGFFSLSAEQKKQLIESAKEELPNGLDSTPDEIAYLAMSLFDIDTYDTSPYENVRHDVYIKLNNPLVYDFKGAGYRDVSYNDLLVQAAEGGHDGVIMANTTDPGPASTLGSFPEPTNIIAVLRGHSSQIKSADPVTYDDAGNVIPLSQRFQKTSPDIRRAAVDRYDERSQVGGIPGVGAIKSTPVGIKAKTRDIVRTMFNSDTISQANTNRAWNLINRFAERNPESNANLSSLNQMVRESMADEASEEILQSIGGPTLQNELFSYAIKLAGQGDKKMLDHLLENPIVVSQGGTASTIGRDLGALGSFSSWLVNASQAERSATIEVLASRLFNTKSPTPEQIAAINTVLSAVKDTKINLGYAIEEEVKEVSEIIGTDIGEKIQSEIVESNPKLDPFAQAMLSLIQLQEAGEDIDFTVMVPARKEPKLSTKMEKMVRDALAKYQSKMGAKGATGLEATFWKTLSSQEEAVGPLADLDMASNRNLAKIVKEVLKKYGLVGTPPKRGEAGSEKLSDIQLVASILTNTPLSKEKVMRADAEITAEIERRYNEEKQAAAGDQTLLDAIEIKYNTLRQAWGEAMGNQLDIPVSEAAMRRLLASEMKEKKIKLRDIIDKPTLAGENQAKRDVVASVIKKMVDLDPQADPNRFAEFEGKLNDIMDSMVATSKAKTKADTARQTIKDTANQPDRQAESAVRSLARMQGDVLDFGKAQPNEVRKIVSNDLQNAPDMGRKQAWKSMFVASLQQAGVSETIAMTLSDLVWRQHEINNLNKQIKQQEDAVTKGPISTIVDAILNTPLGEQQDPKWRENVILQYLVDAGIPSQRASNIAKLFDAAIAKRFAEAQTKAAQKAIAGLKTLDAESKRGFDKLFAAIRAQALNPASNPVREFAKQMGFKEFSGPQLQRLSDLDTIINKDESTDAERARAVSEVQKIINEVALPPRVRDVLSSFYVGQALGRITTALIQVIDPAFYSATNAAISSFRNVTSPTQLGQIWGDYTTSLFRAFREFAFSFQNDINRSGKMVDFLETQDAALIRMNRQAQRDLESGNYAGFVKNTLFGTFPRFTFRTLKALDDAAFSILRDQSLNQYMVAAMNAAKIPKDKQIGVVRTALQAREIDKQNLLNQGMTKTEATVFSDERMKVYVQQALSGVGIPDVVGVVESAINDALSRIGKPRYTTDPETEKEQEIKDLGTLSYPFLKLYELTSQSANQMKGLSGEFYRIFVRTFLGFPVIASRVFNVAAGYTPLTLYRHLIKGRYPLSYGTALQRKQRLIEQFSLTLAVLPLLAMYRGSDDDDKEGTYINFTGVGPSKLNKEFYAQWHKRNEPYSMQLVVDGKSRFTLDAKNSGPFSVMIYMLGAYDDWSMNRRLKDEKTTKDDFRKAEEKMTWANDMLGLLGTFILTSSRRGPTSSVMQGLVDWRRFPDNPLGALASEASFSLLPLVPIVGTGLAKNVSDLLSEPIDTTTLEGALANNIPFVPQMLEKPALNGYGQKLGELQFAEKLKKSTGIPFTFVQFDNENDRKLTDITMKFGVGPSEVSRNDVEISLQRSLTDEEWRGFVKSYGEANAKMVLENYDQLYNMSREAFVYSLREAISPSAKLKAYTDLEKQREKK